MKVLFEHLHFKVFFASGTLFCIDYSDMYTNFSQTDLYLCIKINIEQLVFYKMMMLDMGFG
jgi:hypothetical protein